MLCRYHGGTNFGRTAGAGIATSYDYDAPLDEYGFTREPKYSILKRLHSMLHTYSPTLLKTNTPPPYSKPNQDTYVYKYISSSSDRSSDRSNVSDNTDSRVGSDSTNTSGGGVIFVINTNATVDYAPTIICTATGATVVVSVPKWSVSIVDDSTCTVVYNTAADAADATVITAAPSSDTNAGANVFLASKTNIDIEMMQSPSLWSYFPEPANLSSWCKGTQYTRLPEQIDATGSAATDYLQAEVEVQVTVPAGSRVTATALDVKASPAVGGTFSALPVPLHEGLLHDRSVIHPGRSAGGAPRKSRSSFLC